MILPVVAFWQNEIWLDSARRIVSLSVVIVLGAIAFVLSLPVNGSPDTRARTAGSAIEDRLGGYQDLSPEGFRTSQILHKLFPPSWDRTVPQRNYGGSAIVWYHYANRSRFDPNREINYVLQPSADPAPEGMRLFATHENVALYVRSIAILKQHRAMRPVAPVGSDLYRTERHRLFQSRR